MNTRNVLDDGVWNPHDMYNSVGGSKYSQLNMSSERPSSGTALSLSPSRTLSRKASSVPYHLMASSPNNLLTSSPYNPITSSPISYASSDAQFHSFGGGGAMSGAVGGSLRANPEAMPSAASLSMPYMPTYASARTISASQSEQAAQASSGVMAAAPAVNSYGLSFYNNSFGYTTTAYAGPSLPSSTYLGAVSGRRNSIEDNTYIGWLTGWFGAGAENLTKEQLMEMYIALGGDFTNPEEWEAFWEWIQNSQSEEFQWKLQPLSDAPIFMLLLCLAYIVYVARKRKKQELA